ncbi:Non-specific lipid-transfer protein, partial [Corchorus capsularis]
HYSALKPKTWAKRTPRVPKGSREERPIMFCCMGLSEIDAGATTPNIRMDLCECFHEAAVHGGFKHERAALLNGYCDMVLPQPQKLTLFPPSPDLRCKSSLSMEA